MVRTIILVLAVLVTCLMALAFYGNASRPAADYLSLQPAKLHQVLCISDTGDATTYHIPMPSFEGFTEEDTFDLVESYAQGYCNNL